MENNEIDLRSIAELEPIQVFQFDEEVNDEFYAYAMLENLQRKQFPLKEAGITAKVFNQWRRLGLLPEGEEDGQSLYFDFLQYLWLQIIKDLRNFGLPLKTIVAVKEHLFNESFLYENPLSEEAAAAIRTELEMKIGRQLWKEEFIDATEMFRRGNAYLPYYFSLVILMHFYHRAKTNIYIYSDGEVRVVNDYLKSTKQHIKPDLEQPHLVIPLTRYFASFISDETKADFLSSLPLISEAENQVLQAMRRGEVKELSILFIKEGKGERIDLIAKSDGKMPADKIGQFVQLIASRKNMDITLKSRDGKISYYQIEKRDTIKKA